MTAVPPPPQDPGGPPWQPTNPPAPPGPKGSWVARHKLLSAVLAIGLLSLLCCGASLGGLVSLGGGESPGSGSSSGAQTSGGSKDAKDTKDTKDEALPAIGSKVRDGKFEFTVTDVRTGVASVGDDMLAEKAQGQFVLVDITVSNIGDEAQTMLDSEQKIMDAQGRSFEPNSMAALSMNGGSDLWITEINPGNTVEGTMVFDMPKGAEPVTIELHDSMFSDGVEVSLTR